MPTNEMYITKEVGTRKYCLFVPGRLEYIDLAGGDKVEITTEKRVSALTRPMISAMKQFKLLTHDFPKIPAMKSIEVPNGFIKKFATEMLKLAGPDGHFVLFSNLPLELRRSIWVEARRQHEGSACNNRCVQLIEYGGNGPHYIKAAGDARPGLSGVCREAYEVMIGQVDPMYRIHFSTLQGAGVLFNENIDMVRLEFKLDMPAIPRLQIVDCLKHTTDIQLIRTLSLDCNLFLHFAPWVTLNMGQMSGLRKLALTGQCIDYPRTNVIDLHMSFADISGRKQSLLPRYVGFNGVEFVGFPACMAYFASVRDQYLHQRIFDIWRQLERFLPRTPNFPGLVTLDTKYIPVSPPPPPPPPPAQRLSPN